MWCIISDRNICMYKCIYMYTSTLTLHRDSPTRNSLKWLFVLYCRFKNKIISQHCRFKKNRDIFAEQQHIQYITYYMYNIVYTPKLMYLHQHTYTLLWDSQNHAPTQNSLSAALKRQDRSLVWILMDILK